MTYMESSAINNIFFEGIMHHKLNTVVFEFSDAFFEFDIKCFLKYVSNLIITSDHRFEYISTYLFEENFSIGLDHLDLSY